MTAGPSIAAFVLGAAVSLLTSWVLVSRLERVGERLGLSEALLGMVAALAADAPEVTASVTALAHHQRAVGAGVTIGSNVFNLAALLGLGAVVAGRIGLHRRVVVLGGTVAVVIAAICLLAVAGAITPGTGLALVLVVLVPYTVLLGARRSAIERVGLPRRWSRWLTQAVAEEEIELEEAIHPPHGRPIDAVVALGALAVVVVASVAMEQGASALGVRYGIAEIVVGGLVLAEHRPQLQRHQRHRRTADPGHHRRPEQTVGFGAPGRRLVSRSDRGDLAAGLCVPWAPPEFGLDDHCAVRPLRRRPPGNGLAA
jgi:cation:H+ antiporter